MQRNVKCRIFDKHDVVVVGGGTSGVIAAVAAARIADSVLLIEQHGILGGALSMNLSFSTRRVFDRDSKKIISGITEELFRKAVSLQEGNDAGNSMSIADLREYGLINFDVFKYALTELVSENRVDTLFHTFAFDVTKKNKCVNGVVFVNKSGLQIVPAKVVIDATGDGDICQAAGAEMAMGREKDGRTQAVGVPFVIGNVDIERFRSTNPDVFESTHQHLTSSNAILTMNTPQAWLEVQEREDLPELHSLQMPLSQKYGRKGEVHIVVSLKKPYLGIDGKQLSRAELAAREAGTRTLDFLRRSIPGFEQSYIMAVSPQVGVRETRRMVGEYTLSDQDIINSRRFADVVCRLNYPVGWDHIVDENTIKKSKDPHFWNFPSNETYDVPFRCLLPKEIDGLIATGRAISVTHQAFTSTRVTAACMVLGEVAGLAAGLSVRNAVQPRNLDVGILQKELIGISLLGD
jgi:ribulose 1,5-bisphosphate synthetase/thiazole synthase